MGTGWSLSSGRSQAGPVGRCDKENWLSPTLGDRCSRYAEHRLQAVLVSDVKHLMLSSRGVAGERQPGRLVEQGDAECGGFGRL